jgi:adenylate cyclase, class 2
LTTGQEIEAKFYVQNPAILAARITTLGGQLVRPRTHEINYRFDAQDGKLRESGRLLRIRRDQRVLLTYKDGTQVEDGTLERRELELAVDDFETAMQIINALGYQVVFKYEKYRTTYECGNAEIMLDELPFGNFVEIEGERDAIRSVAEALGLDWTTAIPRSYHALFEQARDRLFLTVRDLTFEAFGEVVVAPADLGVQPADM